MASCAYSICLEASKLLDNHRHSYLASNLQCVFSHPFVIQRHVKRGLSCSLLSHTYFKCPDLQGPQWLYYDQNFHEWAAAKNICKYGELLLPGHQTASFTCISSQKKWKAELKGAMRCLQAKPYKYRCSSCQAAVTSVLANRLFHVLGKDYFMLRKILCGKILCGFITAHSPFNMCYWWNDGIFCYK